MTALTVADAGALGSPDTLICFGGQHRCKAFCRTHLVCWISLEMSVSGPPIVGTSPTRARRWILAPGKIRAARSACFAVAPGAALRMNHAQQVARRLAPRIAVQKLAFGYCASFSSAVASAGTPDFITPISWMQSPIHCGPGAWRHTSHRRRP